MKIGFSNSIDFGDKKVGQGLSQHTAPLPQSVQRV